MSQQPDPFAVPPRPGPPAAGPTGQAPPPQPGWPPPPGPAAVPPPGAWPAGTWPPPPPGWAPPAPPPRRRGPEYDEPQPYHRVLRTRSYRGWRPLVGLLVMGATFLVLTVAITIAGLVPILLRDGLATPDEAVDLAVELVSDPLGLLTLNLSLAAFIPAAILGLLAGHQMRPGWLHSVVGRMRWRFLAVCLAVEVLVSVVVLPLSALVAPSTAGVPSDVPDVSLAAWLPFAVVILLTTPLQAAGEEYAFRGYGLQALGAWVRTPWFGIVVTALMFAAAHGGQSLPLFLDRFAFGVVAGVLTVRTGGLEAAIAFHVVNNVVILLLASASGDLGPSLTVAEAPWSVVLVDVVGMVLFAAAALALAGKMGLQTRTTPTPRPAPWHLVAPAPPR